MTTIKDVAKRAGVGTSTVSRVLNNSPLVSIEKKERVLRAIKELDYHPSVLAKGLATDSSYTIGYIMDNTMDKAYANPFIYEVFRGIEKAVYEGGYNLLLVGQNTFIDGKLAVEQVLKRKIVDGLILPSKLIKSEYLNCINKYNIPIVSIGKLNDIKKISYVDIDNYRGGYKAAEYLFSRGYRKIAFAGKFTNEDFASDRYMGYKQFMNEKGLQCAIFNETLENNDAIICLDNMVAYEVLQLCKKLKKNIPNEIGIITFDNYPIAEFLEPKITHINIDLYKVGRKAGEEMLRQVKLKEVKAKQILIPVTINVRESTK